MRFAPRSITRRIMANRAQAVEETVGTIALPRVAIARRSFTFIGFQVDRSRPPRGHTGNMTTRQHG